MSGDILSLCDVVRETGFALHRYLRNGHFERVYEKGLVHRLSKQGVKVQAQWPLKVCDEDGEVLGEYCADLLVEGRLIVELKACSSLTDEHISQLLGYLRACRIEHGMLMNFGAARFQVRKFVLTHHELDEKDCSAQ